MKAHLQYLRYLLRHKWFVFQAGRMLGIPFLAALHDNSKFRPSEWFPYVASFYGKAGRTPEVRARFEHAWFLHQKRNKHHWQHWLLLPRGAACCSPNRPTYGDERLRTAYASQMVPPWEIDLVPQDDGGVKCVICGRHEAMPVDALTIPMPDNYRRELLADWIGVGKALGTSGVVDWYAANRHKMELHGETRAWIEDALALGLGEPRRTPEEEHALAERITRLEALRHQEQRSC